jgi:putative AbiEi antitoxin of type IV toxin-antitoxin system/uncharacterized protein DUF559
MPTEPPFSRAIATRSGMSADRWIAEVADSQHGVISRSQLHEAGLGRDAIHHRLAGGRLHRLHRGVYAVGHRCLTREGRWMGAVLAAGPGAVLSHRSAAALWGIRPSEVLEVTIPVHRAPPRVRTHTCALPSDEVTAVETIPVTGVSRTLLDLAAVVPAPHVERAAGEAETRRLTDRLSLTELVDRYPGRRGIRAVRTLLDAGITFTRSELEARFVALCRARGLPPAAANASVLGFECDFAWTAQRVVAELDGFAYHASRRSFELDRARDRALQAAGWRVVRITWRQLDASPDAVAADLRRMLAAPGPRRGRARAGGP